MVWLSNYLRKRFYDNMMEITSQEIKQKKAEASLLVDANQNVGNIERIISAVAAVLVSIYVVKRKDTFVGKVLGSLRGFPFDKGYYWILAT